MLGLTECLAIEQDGKQHGYDEEYTNVANYTNVSQLHVVERNTASAWGPAFMVFTAGGFGATWYSLRLCPSVTAG